MKLAFGGLRLGMPPADDDVLAYASASRYPVRNRVIVLLSVKAGLRAGEIANLTWPMVVDRSGEIAPYIELHDGAAKMRSGRRVPLHNNLREALARWREVNDSTQHVVYSERGGGLTPSSIARRRVLIARPRYDRNSKATGKWRRPGFLFEPLGSLQDRLTKAIEVEPDLGAPLFELDQPRMHLMAVALAHQRR